MINTKTMEVERSLSVERPQGLGTAPVAVSVTRDGSRLIVSNSGEDAVAAFALPGCAAEELAPRRGGPTTFSSTEGRRNVEQAEIEREEAARDLRRGGRGGGRGSERRPRPCSGGRRTGR